LEARLAIAVGLLLLLLLLLLDSELGLGGESGWLGHQSILELTLAHEARRLGHLGLVILTRGTKWLTSLRETCQLSL
jgi:hypothetical protein